MQIREDIYPELKDTLLWSREGELERRINQAFNTLSTFFKTKEEVAKYVNNFQESDHAELFLDVCSFYNIAKNYAEHPFLKFIMMISSLEKVSNPKHKSFKDWLVSGGNKELVEKELDKLESPEYGTIKKMIERLSEEEYIEKFGALRNLRQFLWENLEKEEKIELVKSFKTRKKKYVESVIPETAGKFDSLKKCAKTLSKEIQEGYLPRCYEWKKCYIQYGKCHPDVNCPLHGDEDKLRKEFNYINRIIYDYRSMFAHKARAPPFSADDDILHVTDIYEGGLILIEFTLVDFEEIVDDVLKRYFDGLPKRN